MIIKVIRQYIFGLVRDTPFDFRDVTDFFPDLRGVSSLIVCHVFLESPVHLLKLLR